MPRNGSAPLIFRKPLIPDHPTPGIAPLEWQPRNGENNETKQNNETNNIQQTNYTNMKTAKNELHSLMVEQLRDILWAEKELVKALPKMAQAAKDEKLKKAFTDHKSETEEHIKRLHKVFEQINLAPRAKKCEAMAGLIKEAEEIKDQFEDSAALDAALIAAAQKVEHYEIASYGSLRAFAKCLDQKEIVALLTTTIEEEGAADHKLTKIAEGGANQSAV